MVIPESSFIWPSLVGADLRQELVKEEQEERKTVTVGGGGSGDFENLA